MRNRYSYIFVLFFLVNASLIYGQSYTLDTLRQRFDHYRRNSFQEKIFVHTDQNFYLTGENLWFRIFYVDGVTHQPASLSKVAYVEMLDKQGKPVLQSKVELAVGKGEGSLFIPATLATGDYVLRIYTQWMKNFEAEFYAHKQISIVNPFVRPDYEPAKGAQKPLIEFFPEGGVLLAGHRSRVGFKITSQSTPDSLRGVVIRNGKDTVAMVNSLKFGLGHFYLDATAEDVYNCVVTDQSGRSFNYSLPKVQQSGFAMALSDTIPGQVRIRVVSKSLNPNAPVFLFAHSRQIMLHAESKLLIDGKTEFVLDRNILPGGVSHFTVFDGDLKPVCERLYFTVPDKKLEFKIQADQQSYTTRRKVGVEVETTFHGKLTPADISVAVFKMDSLSMLSQEDIYSYLYLTSDLSGDVESPEYYFSNDAGPRAASENLMLTHGWRKFKWQEVLEKKTAKSFIPEFRSHLVTGKVTNVDNTPATGVLTYLSSPGKLVNVYGARSNEKGLVQFEVRDFWGTRQLIMQTDSSVDSTYTLAVTNPYDERPVAYKIRPLKITPDMEDRLNARSISMQVQDIYLREESERTRSVKHDSTAFYGKPDETYFLDDYTRFPVMEEVMREYVPGVLVRKRKDGFRFIVIDKINNGLLPDHPLILMDGVPVFDPDDVMAFDPLRVKKLEVVTRNYYSGPLALPGIVSYSTYGGDLGGFQIDPRSVRMNYEGLQLQREFYSPTYENQKLRGSRLPDQRQLLFWAPQVKMENGKASLEFFTSDVTGEYVIIVNGLAAGGMAGSSSSGLIVKQSDF